ncbi:MAG: hypothetical protein ACLTLY_05405 [Agathobacter rectalis]
MAKIKQREEEGYTYIKDMCYDGTLSTAFDLSSWLFTEGEKHGGMYIGFDSKKKKIVWEYGRY